MEGASLLEVIAERAQTTPDKPCLIDSETGRSVSYGMFWDHIRAFAARLRQLGLNREDRVVVRVGAPIETFVAQYGVNLAGGVFCPVEKHMKPLKLLELLEYYDSAFLVSSQAVDFPGCWVDLESVCQSGTEDMAQAGGEELPFPRAEELCAIVFTTGTTGKAKGVMGSYGSHLISARMRCQAYGITEKDIYCWVRPLDRESGLRHFGVALAAGATAVHYNGVVFVGSFLKSLRQYGVTTIHIQSFSITMLLRAAPDALREYGGQLRAMTFSSGALPEVYREQLRQLLPSTRLFIQYSSTEVSAIAFYEYSRDPGRENCVGKPFPGVEVELLDEDGAPMEHSSRSRLGNIACHSPTRMLGYWNDPELTAETLQDGWVTMTDMGYRDEDGYLYLMGRRDDVIVSGGHKIAPYELENVAAGMEGVSECVCVPAANDLLGAVPKLFVVMRPGAEFSAKAVYDYLAARLETYKLPRVIRELEALPRIPGSGKINRRELLQYD